MFDSLIQRTGESTRYNIESLRSLARAENTAAVIAQLEAIEKTAAAARQFLAPETDGMQDTANSGQTEAEAV